MKNLGFLRSAKRRLRLFSRDSEGSAGMEFVLWTPTFMFIMMLAIDASVLFMNQSNYWRVTRDTARLVARHAITLDEAKDYAESMVAGSNANPTATVTSDGQIIMVNLTSSATDLTPFTLFDFVWSFNVEATTFQSVEPI